MSSHDPLAMAQTTAVGRLTTALTRMMEKVDDALFELADKAENNTVQSRYFDAMREIRLKRPAVQMRFKQKLEQAFEGRPKASRSGESKPETLSAPGAMPSLLDDDGLPALQLVENDELEESLAVSNMVTKLHAGCKDALFALDRRMGLLLKDPELRMFGNPVGPETVCGAIQDACNEIESEIEIKLIVLKLFDKLVVNEIPAIYDDLNAALADQGVLPNIRRDYRGKTVSQPVRPVDPNGVNRDTDPHLQDAPSGSPAGAGYGHPPAAAGTSYQQAAPGRVQPPVSGVAGGGEPTAGAAGHSVSDGFPLAEQDLLATLRQVMTLHAGGNSPGIGATQTRASGALDSLTLLQQGRAPGEGQGYAINIPAMADGRNSILRELKQSDVIGGMDRVDSMMIDIVAMMFDYILDDRGIPDPMKALLGRLQIPILKVAILDKTFFARKFHPARKLLNNLAEAAVGWQEERDGDDALHRLVTDIVHRILNEFEDDISLFSEVLKELEAFLAAEAQRVDECAEEAMDQIEARERLKTARREAQTEVRRRTAGERIPDVVREFLEVYWKNFLAIAYNNGGEDSEEWQNGIETMDDLVWSITPKQIPEERDRLKTLLPSLLKRLNEGMSRVSVPDGFRNKLMATLVELHLGAVKHEATVTTDEVVGLPLDEAPGDPSALSREPAAGEPDAGPPQVQGAREDGIMSAASAGGADSGPDPGNDTGIDVIIGDILGENGSTDQLDEAEYSPQTLSVRAAVHRANDVIHRTAGSKPECQGMGTTLVAARFFDNRISVTHVGDSRLYRLRGGHLEQITVDHSLRQELVDRGFLTPEEAQKSAKKHLVTRAVGIDSVVKPDSQEDLVRPGDLYLLCSDGLTDMVEEPAIHTVLESDDLDLEEGCRSLVRLANDNGGKDNISVILAQVLQPFPGAPSDDGPGNLKGALHIANMTDVGKNRAHNEDYVDHDENSGIAVLADGMGGYNAGEVASSVAVRTVMEEIRRESQGKDAPGEPTAAAAGDGEPEPGHADFDFDALNALFSSTPSIAPRRDEEALAPAQDEDEPSATGAGSEDPDIEEITLFGMEGKPPREAEDEYTTVARNLEIGSWVEFQAQGDKTIRARLTWVSPVTGACLFTNRKGLKVVDTTVLGLAAELRRGTAVLMGDVPLFDRAVSSLMDRLNKKPADPLQ